MVFSRRPRESSDASVSTHRRARRLVGCDRDEGDAEVEDLGEHAVRLCLVGHGAAKVSQRRPVGKRRPRAAPGLSAASSPTTRSRPRRQRRLLAPRHRPRPLHLPRTRHHLEPPALTFRVVTPRNRAGLLLVSDDMSKIPPWGTERRSQPSSHRLGDLQAQRHHCLGLSSSSATS